MSMMRLVLGLAVAFLGTSVSAQFVKGNEAVSTHRPGAPDLPPLPRVPGDVCSPAERCSTSLWFMVETRAGLQECTEPYARPGACRPSSYGSTKLSRLWVVKSKGVWLQCQYPDLGSKCVPIFGRPPANLPWSAYQ